MTKINNITRQLIDLINEGSKFKSLDYVIEENVDRFNDYSKEIKSFLGDNINNEMIQERLKKIDEINYEREKLNIWMMLLHLIVFPWYIYMMLKDYQAKKVCQERILETVSIFSSIEFLIRNNE